jgi:hypothetical protein
LNPKILRCSSLRGKEWREGGRENRGREREREEEEKEEK